MLCHTHLYQSSSSRYPKKSFTYYYGFPSYISSFSVLSFFSAIFHFLLAASQLTVSITMSSLTGIAVKDLDKGMDLVEFKAEPVDLSGFKHLTRFF